MRLLPVLLLLVSVPGYAGLYQWTDANGQTHFSDSVPPGQESHVKQKGMTAAPPMQAPQEAQKARDREAAALHTVQKKRQDDEKAASEAASAADQREQLCRRAKSRFEFLGRGRVFVTDANGERKFYTDEELSQQRQQLQQVMQENCN
jgi:hypothetical protein